MLRQQGAKSQMINKTYIITGGTGSLGQAIVKALLRRRVKKIIILSRNEHAQVLMKRDLDDKRLRFFLGDVRDLDRLKRAMQGVDIVIHCAALKHIDMCSYNPDETIDTNVIGSQNVRDAAICNNVEKCLLISSDKACNPSNLYGATKYAAEQIFATASAYAGAKGCKFASIRFGNFIGSSGSVVPLFKKLRDAGAEYLPITDKRMTRFMITFGEAVERIFAALDLMRGGEVFCPKMPSMKITDVAAAIAPGAALKEIGIRIGEKLHEEMVTQVEAARTRELKGFFVIYPDGSGEGRKVPEGFAYDSGSNGQWMEAVRIDAV